MGRPATGSNRLLAALPPADLALLSPHLQKVSLEQDAVVVRLGDRREHVYFPHSGAISFMLDMPNGATIATAVIGREGALGALSVLGPSRSSVTAVVRVGGTASQISVSRFHAAYMVSSAIRDVVQAHTGAILMQLQHVAAVMGCTRSRPAWPAGCLNCAIEPRAPSCQSRRRRFRSCLECDEPP
jgi:CRP-like cAMP-binding protein